MLVGRFAIIVLVLAAGGSFAAQHVIPRSAGTLPTEGTTFICLLLGVIVIVGGLTYLPALALGPITENLSPRFTKDPSINNQSIRLFERTMRRRGPNARRSNATQRRRLCSFATKAIPMALDWVQCFPLRGYRCAHTITTLALSPNCSAVSRRDAPAAVASITRSRMSIEYGLGIVHPAKANQCCRLAHS
jgi:hypothetical protein